MYLKAISLCFCSVRSTATLFCYCRADAVKDERSEVNHIIANACALYTEVSCVKDAVKRSDCVNPATNYSLYYIYLSQGFVDNFDSLASDVCQAVDGCGV